MESSKKSLILKALEKIENIVKYFLAFLSEDPRNDVTFCIFAAASITSIILTVRYFGHLTDNDINALIVIQGGGSVPQGIKVAGNVISAIQSKLAG